jgi:predicted ATPase
MRLNSIWIGAFKNLRDFSMAFDAEPLPTVLVGRNGAGKSNLLEALVIIFRDLDIGRRTDFAYRIEYSLATEQVFIRWDPADTGAAFQATVNGKPMPKGRLTHKSGRKLPRFVFGYYSGPSDRMAEHFRDHQERYYDALLRIRHTEIETTELRPLFYARLIHSQFVLLAFFMREDAEIRQFLQSHLRIEGLDSVLFVMRQPGWAKTKNTAKERFWKAGFEVRDFMERLYAVSLAPMQASWKVPIAFRKSTTREHLYLYLRGEAELQRLAQSYASEQHFFTALESTYLSEMIAEVRIRVKVRGADNVLTYRELSEGEQQLLMVLGLLRFTREDESLFLLDEPDTHLNPAWSLEYLDLLAKVIGDYSTSHILMTTHDPLVLTNLKRTQVQVMLRDENTGMIRVQPSVFDPKDMGVDGLLTSDLFGLQTTIGTELQSLLAERASLIAFGSERTEPQETRLRDLTRELSQKGFANVADDPIYSRFVAAMAKREDWNRPVLTREEQANQERIADEVLAEVLPRDES